MAKWILSLLIVSAVLVSTALAQPEGRQRGPREGQRERPTMAQMYERAGIELTDAQKEKLEAIGAEMQKVMEKVREAEDRRAAFEAAREEMTKLREKAEAVLTAEQKEKLAKWREEQRERRPAPREGERPQRPDGGRRPRGERPST
jgi:Spy/CpxP family protein refolding chaperone